VVNRPARTWTPPHQAPVLGSMRQMAASWGLRSPGSSSASSACSSNGAAWHPLRRARRQLPRRCRPGRHH